jgi:hypothetical protein
MTEQSPTAIVCGACGKIQGVHDGWDESCAMHAIEVHRASIVRNDRGLVCSADGTGRPLKAHERWP